MTAAYLVWRTLITVGLGVWWVALPLLLVEIHNGAGLLLHTLALWDVGVSPTWRPVGATRFRVAVLIATYNEPPEILLPTIAAAVGLLPVHETWVLDDGRREEIRHLAEALGANYLTRPDNAHAKAGNLNHALARIDADLVAVFDADHVPRPDFLRHTLCYFDDERVALVQTPQDFYNRDSFEHEGAEGADGGFNEEAMFYRVIAPGKNRWGGAFWCGTNAVVRVAALRSVGGVATDSVTEDILTTIRMFRHGWRGVYHNEILARGLAPSDALQYMVQRNRWAMGAMQVLRVENPLFGRGLSIGQRLSLMTTLMGWFDSWRTLVYTLLPPAILLTGVSPIEAPGYLYAPFFLATFLLQFFTLRLLARGHYPPLLSLIFEVLRLPAVLPATMALFTGGSGKFRVTPKGRTSGRASSSIPTVLKVLLLASLIGIAYGLASVAGLTPTSYRHPPAIIGAGVFAIGNAMLVILAIRRLRDARFAGERRASIRFPVEMKGRFDGIACQIRDLSLTGARVFPAERAVDRQLGNLVVTLPHGEATLRCHIRRRLLQLHDAMELGLEFASGQETTVAQIALALLNGEDTALTPAQVEAA